MSAQAVPHGQPRPVFAAAVEAYVRAGWPCVLPIPAGRKTPPPAGTTGDAPGDPSAAQLTAWAAARPADSVALRMPAGVIGLDVDDYTKGAVSKRGAATLAAAVQRLGEPPATWSSTARGDGAGPGVSRIAFYRVPSGRYATTLGPDVEVIQRHHRYAVVAPSPHPEVGQPYRWYHPDGRPAKHGQVPSVAELPWLPSEWTAHLAAGAAATSALPASAQAGQRLMDELRADHRPPCAEITSAALTAVAALTAADAGSRHDTATARVHCLVQLAAAGHPGVGGALRELHEHWERLTEGEDRSDEWDRMVLGSTRKAVTSLGQAGQVTIDPCLIVPAGAMGVPGQMPADDRSGAAGLTDPHEPIQPERLWSLREVIGVHAFDPAADLDQTLAEAVLQRTHPGLRAVDAGQWLRRGPDAWESAADLSRWAVAQVGGLMPHGDPGAEKGSAEQVRAARRARLLSDRGSAAVASKMRALVAAGDHPSSVLLADLDAEPEILWAAGRAFDLRRSGTAPAPAALDPGTPHLRSAAVLPVAGPAPLWDAFTAAVWPDPDLRGWALRVLSVAFTGYPDAALPILAGLTGRGKTALVRLLMSLLGSYAHAADPRLLSSADNTHASIVWALKGRRLSFVDEGPREGRWATERLKQLTGGAPLTGNQMHANPITFDPSHTLILTANDEPTLTDAAVRRRVRLLPCEGDPAEVEATRAAIGPVGGAAWRAEAPAVLAALMAHSAAWLAEPSTAELSAAPANVRYRAEEIAAEQDPVRGWVEDECEPNPAGTRSRALYEAFIAWSRAGNVHPSRIPTETQWGRVLGQLGYLSTHHHTGKRRPLRVRPVVPITTAWPPLPPASGGG